MYHIPLHLFSRFLVCKLEFCSPIHTLLLCGVLCADIIASVVMPAKRKFEQMSSLEAASDDAYYQLTGDQHRRVQPDWYWCWQCGNEFHWTQVEQFWRKHMWTYSPYCYLCMHAWRAEKGDYRFQFPIHNGVIQYSNIQ